MRSVCVVYIEIQTNKGSMCKPVAGTPDANTAAFPCTCFQCPGRPLSLGGWGAHQAGFHNIILQNYQGFSVESQRLTIP